MRAHLIDSDEPLRENQTIVGLCGTAIPTAKFVFMLDTSFGAGSLNTLLCCRKCLSVETSRRYLYGFCEGQRLLTGENGPSL